MNQIKQLDIWLEAYNMRHSLMEGGATLVMLDGGSLRLEYDDETIKLFDLDDVDSIRDYLLSE